MLKDSVPQALASVQLDSYLDPVRDRLRSFLANPDFERDIRMAFGASVDVARARKLIEVFADPLATDFPRFEIRPDAEIGYANGAYVAGDDTILLSAGFVRENVENPEIIVAVFLEELGHALDARFNTVDATGDEGAIFSALVLGQELSDAQLLTLRAEKDTAIIAIDGTPVALEFSDFSLGPLQVADVFSDSITAVDPGDRWSFSINYTGGLTDYVLATSSSPYVDLVLDLYQNGTLIRHVDLDTPSGGNEEEVSLAGLAPGNYTAVVYDNLNGVTLLNASLLGLITSPSASYSLTIAPPEGPLIQEDAYESNNTFLTATLVTQGALVAPGQYMFTGLSIDTPPNPSRPDGDLDVFKFTTTKVSTDQHMVLSYVSGTGDIDLELHDGAGNLVYETFWAAGSGWNGISLAGLPAGTYYLVTGSFTGVVTPRYDLFFSLPESPKSDHFDATAANNTLATATNLGLVSGFFKDQDLSIHQSSDVDWYKFQINGPATNQNYLKIDFDGSLGDLDITLYDATGANVIDSSKGVGDSELISLSGLTAGTYVLKVNGFLGSTNDYQLTLNAPGTTSTITGDVLEAGAGNNTRANATVLASAATGWLQGKGTFVFENLSIGTSDQDWFKLTLPSAATYGNFVSANFDTTQGDLDLELYSATGTSPLRTSAGFRDVENIDLGGLAAGDYYVRVVGFQGAKNPNYALSVNVPGGDVFENNDTQADAKPLSRATAHQTWDGLSMDDAADWYSFKLSSKGTANDFVRIDFAHALGDLDLKLYNSAGSALSGRSSIGTRDGEQVSLDGLAAGDYKIQVYGYNGAKNAGYSLTVDAPVGGAQDFAEGNNTQATATDLKTYNQSGTDLVRLGMDAEKPLSIHSTSDVDWYKLTLATAGRSGDVATLNLDHTAGDLDLYLYNATNTLVRKSEGVANQHSIDLKGLAAGTYYLLVEGYDPARANPLAAGTATAATNSSYALSVNAPFSAVAGDWAEGNNTQATAKDLGAISKVYDRGNLSIQAGDRDWFKFKLGGTGVAGDEVGIRYNQGQGDLDMKLYKLNGTTLTLVDSSAGATGLERVSLNGQGAGDYYVEVFGRTGTVTNPEYKLVIDPPKDTTPDWAEGTALNDTVATAFNLRTVEGAQTWQPLSLHRSGDVDWFKFTTTKTADANDQVQIRFNQADGDLDLYLYDAAGTTLLGKAETSDGLEVIKLVNGSTGAPLAAGTYTVKVVGYNGAANPSYQLAVNAPSVAPADWAEGNNTRTAAKNLQDVQGAKTFSGLSIHQAGDQDYFSFATKGIGSASHFVSIDFDRGDNGKNDLQLALLDSAGTVLARSETDGNREKISLENRPAGQYFVQVYGKDGTVANGAYTLSFDAPQTPEADFTDANGKSNNTLATAYDLRTVNGGLFVNGLSIHPATDVDWFKFRLDKAGGVNNRVRIDFDHSEGNLNLELYNSAGTLIGTSATSENFEEIALNGKAAGTYYAKVVGAGGAVNPEYGLTVVGTPALQGDAAEGNDNPTSAFYFQDLGSISQVAKVYPPKGSYTLTGTYTPYGQASAQAGNTNGVPVSIGRSALEDGLINGYVQKGFVNYWDQNTLANTAGSSWANTFGGALDLGLGSYPGVQGVSMPWSNSQLDINLGALKPGARLGGTDPSLLLADGGFDKFGLNGISTGGINLSSLLSSGALSGANYNLSSQFLNNQFFGGFGSGLSQPLLPYQYTASDFRLPYDVNGAFSGGGGNFTNPFNNIWNNWRSDSQPVVTLPGLSIDKPTDQDWFKFDLTRDGAEGQFVGIRFDHDQGALKIELFEKFDPATNTTETQYRTYLVETVATSGDNARISLEGLAQGTYFVRVSGVNGATNPDYSLLLSAPAQMDSGGDWAEASGNNTAATAYDLRSLEGGKALTGLSIHTASDQDWFRFTTQATGGENDKVRIDFDDASGDLDLVLYDSTGATVLKTSSTTENFEEISLKGLAAGSYTVKVAGYSGAVNPEYSLSVVAPEKTVLPDGLEPNNGPTTALNLDVANGVDAIGGTIHLGDQDWFKFTTNGAGTKDSSLALQFDAGRGDLQVELFSAANTTTALRTGAGSGGNEAVSLDGLAAGTYYAKVSGAAGVANAYQLNLDVPDGAQTKNDWTVLVYMTGSNLAEYAFTDINEMEFAAAGLPKNTNFVVLWDQSSLSKTYGTGGSAAWGDTGRAVIRPDLNEDRIATSFERIGETNTGSATTLVDFVKWGAAAAPANHYALVMWDHGGGSLNGFNVDDEGNAQNSTADRLYTSELASALGTLATAGINNIDLISFDACLMANAEVCYALGGYTDVVVASEEVVGADGFNYKGAYDPLALDSKATAAQIAAGLVDTFQRQNQGKMENTLSAMDTSKFGAFVTALKTFADAAVALTDAATWNTLFQARAATTDFDTPVYADLGQFLANVRDSGVVAALKTAAGNAFNALQEVVIDRTADPRQVQGMSIYLPESGAIAGNYLTENAGFLTATNWDDFVTAFLSRPTNRSTVFQGDWAESNDIAARATNLHDLIGDGHALTGLSLDTKADVDWYRFGITGVGAASDTLTATYNNASGERLKLSLYSIDDRGTPKQVSLDAATGTETVGLSGLGVAGKTTQFLLKVESTGTGGVSQYGITLNTPGTVANGNDWAGANKTSGKAEDLGVIASKTWETGLRVDPANPDWFRFESPKTQTPEPGTVFVRVTGTQTVTAELYLDDGTATGQLLNSQSGTGTLQVHYPPIAGQKFLLKISQPTTATAASYSLDFGLYQTTMTGGALNDRITGGSQNDTLTGLAGNDILDGGAGNDRLDGGAGTDTANYASATAGVTVSLALTAAQNTVGAGTDTLVAIENLTGSKFNDTLTGNASANFIDGGTGTDRMTGGDGNDTYVVDNTGDIVVETNASASQIDVVQSSASTYTLPANVENLQLLGTASRNGTGNALNNTLNGNAGNNVLDGAAGTDAVSYANATAAVTVNLGITTAQNTVGAGTDTLLNFENLTGSNFSDTLTGNAGGNVLIGGAGNDRLDGAGGVDAASYSTASAGVTVNLGLTTAQNTVGAGTDTLINIENLTGSNFNDSLTGNSGGNVLTGGLGDDRLDGGAGNDMADYGNATSGVTVSLALLTAQNTLGAGIDTLVNFEDLGGTEFDDVLTGSSNPNLLEGRGGNDVIDGGAGYDWVSYTRAASGVTVNLGITTAQDTKGNGVDTLRNIEAILGSAFNDNLIGGTGDDFLIGGGGNDILNGGTGYDSTTYDHATAGVTINLGLTTAQNTGSAGIDTLIGIEALTGTFFDDVLTGDEFGNTIRGLAGNDRLDGGGGWDDLSYDNAPSAVTVNLGLLTAQDTLGAGVDTVVNFEALIGSRFNDTLTGSAGDNALVGGDGDDRLDGGAGTDTAFYGWASSAVSVNLGLTTAQNTLGAGIDTLVNLEDLRGSEFNDTLIGSAGDNVLTGSGGNDVLQGKAGFDALDGGSGADKYVFDTSLNEVTNVDLILGFNGAEDRIRLDDAIFSKFAGATSVAAGSFVANAGGVAADANDYLLYDTTTGNLFYDPDGTGALVKTLFTVLDNKAALTASAFEIV